jgi:hypothetical protein
MLESLRKQTVTVGASAGALTAATTLAAFVGSVSPEDGLVYYGWIDPAAVTAPMPGQFYVISAKGEVREPLCSLTESDFAPLDDRRRGVQFVNRLGEAMPGVIRSSLPYVLEWPAVERRYVPVSHLLHHNGRILEQRDLAALAKELSAEDFAEISRLESCAQAIVTSLKNGLQICQLTEVATDRETDDRLGVDFASLCLASQTDTEPRPLPELHDHSMWTTIKSRIGVIERRSS